MNYTIKMMIGNYLRRHNTELHGEVDDDDDDDEECCRCTSGCVGWNELCSLEDCHTSEGMDVIDIITEELQHIGAAGLCSYDCGCGLNDLAPCGDGPYTECVAARQEYQDLSDEFGPDAKHEAVYFPFDMLLDLDTEHSV